MAKFLQLIAPLATLAAPQATPVMAQTQQANTTNVGATPLSSGNYEYVPAPSANLSFDNYKDIIIDIKNNDVSNQFAQYLIEKVLVGKFQDGDLNITQFIAHSPFTSISAIFRDIAKKSIDDFVLNVLPTLHGKTMSSEIDSELTKLRDTIVNEFNNYKLPDDMYLEALSTTTDLSGFVEDLKKTVPLKETDTQTLLIAASKDILDEFANNSNGSVDAFQKAIIANFANVDAFRGGVAHKIAESYIKGDEIADKIKEDVEKEYSKDEANIRKFGLERLSTEFEKVKTEYNDILDGKTTGIGAKKIAEKLMTDLEGIATLSDATKCINDFETSKTFLTISAKALITNKANDLIKNVQDEWDDVITSIESPISYWDAIQVSRLIPKGKTDNSKDIDALRILLNDQKPLDEFLAKWSSSDLKNQKIANIDFQFEWLFDNALPNGQKTIANATVVLSKEVKAAEDSQNNFVPNYSSNLDIWEYNINQNQVDVSINDLAEIIKDDFSKNSKPTEATNVWAVNPTVSSLDMDRFWNAKETINGTATPITQSDFDPEIMTFNKLDDVEKLFPRLKSIIEDSDLIGSDGQTTTPNEFKETLQDALFGSNPITDISIVNKPTDKKTGAKATNYDVELVITDTTKQTTKAVGIQANNVSIYDEELDATFENALKTLIAKTPADDGESDDAKSFAGVVVGQLWKLPNVSEGIPGTYDFKNLYELLNIFWFNSKGEGQEVNAITPSFEDSLKNDQDVIKAKAKIDGLKDDDPAKKIAKKEYEILLLSKLTAEQQRAQLKTIQGLIYEGNKVNPLQQLESTDDVIKYLNVSGKISWDQDATGKWEANVSFTSSSSRWKTDFTTAKSFPVAIRELSKEINDSTTVVNKADEYYKPLLEQLNAIGDLSDDAYAKLKAQVELLKSKFEKAVYQEDTPAGINALKELYVGHPVIYETNDDGSYKLDAANNKIVKSSKTIGLIGDAINKSLNLQPSDELLELPETDPTKQPIIPKYIQGYDSKGTELLHDNSIILTSTNASTQFHQAYSDYRNVLGQVAPTLAAGILNNPDPTLTKDSLVASIERYITLKSREKLGDLVDKSLSNNEKIEISGLEETFKIAGISNEIQTLINPIIKVETIANAVYNVAEESATINASGINDEIKRLATYKIADYLAHSDLSDIQKLKNIKDFLKNPLGASQVKLSVPMKATVLALGGFMALVGLGASFSTLRSIFTNKNLKTIGEDASIEYEKPKKTMAIKTVISVAALMSAATIITLVLTLCGGL